MSRRAAAWLAFSMVALAVLLGVLGSLLLILNDRFPPPFGGILLAFISLWRHPGSACALYWDPGGA